MKSWKSNMIFKVVLTLTSWLLALSTYAQNVEVSASLDTNNIRIGDPVKLRITAVYRSDKGEPKIKWPKFTDTITGTIEIIEQTQIEKAPHPGKALTLVMEQTYTITSFDSGYHAIPPFQFIINGDTSNIAETEPMLLTVHSIETDTTQAIRDIKGVMDQPFSWKEALPYIIGGVAILAIAALIFWLVKRKKNKPVLPEKPKIIIPPHITALKSLEALKEQRLWQEGKVKQYHSAISDILRQYIEDRFNVNALEQTTDEILVSFRSVVIDIESRSKLKQVLTLADLVKFAKEVPLPHENEMSLGNAFDFVSNTRREEPKPDANNITQG
jgi:hypothetical protein